MLARWKGFLKAYETDEVEWVMLAWEFSSINERKERKKMKKYVRARNDISKVEDG